MNYWDTVRQRRYSRRIALRGAAVGAGLGALTLIGCGGGGDSSSGGNAQGLATDPVDTTSKATKGGTMAQVLNQDVTSFDVIAGNTGVAFTQGSYSYSRLMRFKPGKFPAIPDASLEADAAIAWEASADGTEFTFKLRPNMKYDPRPPTNNRALSAADVLYSWDRFVAGNQQRTDLANSTNPAAPVLSVTAPDAMTIKYKLAYPSAPFLTNLSYYRYGGIMPVETEQFNFKGDTRGTAPWRLKEYLPGVIVRYEKNPDWYDAAKVNLDGINFHIVPDYGTALAQFRSGNLWTYAVLKEDILQTKRDLPELLMQSSDFTNTLSPWQSGAAAKDSIFWDDRVRIAMSKLIDRDLWIDTFYNVSNFQKEGLDVKTGWTTHVPVGMSQYWLDPKGKELGEGAKNFFHDPADAKKLLQAAGLKLPIEMPLHFTHNGYGPVYIQQVNAFQGFFESGGDFRFTQKNHDYATDWTPNFHQGYGKWDGWAIGTMSTQPDIDGSLFEVYRTGSIKKHNGFDDPVLDAKIDAQRKEMNPQRRTELVKDFQRYAATKMFAIHGPGQAQSFTLAQPWYGNYGVYDGYEGGNVSSEVYNLMWYDASKKKA